MSRGFSTTFGAATTDLITTNFAAGNTVKSSFFCWLYIRAFTGSLTRVLGNSVAATYLAIQAGGYQIQFNFSTTNGIWNSSAAPTTGKWMAVAMTYDGTSTSNNPSLYIDGVSQSLPINVNPTGTYQQVAGNTLIGNAGNGLRVLDGMIAHFSMWNNLILGTGSISALSNGVNPSLIHSDSLVLYLPLDGVNNPESDLINGTSFSITGTRLGASEPSAKSVLQSYQTFLDASFPAAVAAAIAARQQGDAGAVSGNMAVPASIAVAQPVDYGTLSLTEIIASTITAWQQANFISLSVAEVIGAAVAAAQRSNYGNISVDAAVAAAIAAWQRPNYAALSIDEAVSAAIAAAQGADYGAISLSEIIAATVAGWQQVNFASLAAADIISATIMAVQRSNYASVSVDEAVGAAVAAYQKVNNSFLIADLVVPAVLNVWQRGDFGSISMWEIIDAVMAATQRIDYGRIVVPIATVNAIAKVNAQNLYGAGLTNAAVYNAAVGNSRLYNATVGASL